LAAVAQSVSDAQAINDSAMEYIKQITTLERLSLSGCRSITSEGFLAMTGALTNLRALSFQAEQLQDEDAAAGLRSLSKLTYLDLFQCSKVGDPTMLAIATSIPSIKELDIGQCRGVTDQGIAVLSQCTNLDYLYYSRGVGFTGATIGQLTTLSRLWLAYLPNLNNRGMICRLI
jgi:Leucine-rich repeat (LRR) protein